LECRVQTLFMFQYVYLVHGISKFVRVYVCLLIVCNSIVILARHHLSAPSLSFSSNKITAVDVRIKTAPKLYTVHCTVRLLAECLPLSLFLSFVRRRDTTPLHSNSSLFPNKSHHTTMSSSATPRSPSAAARSTTTSASYRQYTRAGSSSSATENLPPRTLARVAREVRDLHKNPPENVRLVVDPATGMPNNLGELMVRTLCLLLLVLVMVALVMS
jgi:hypothetical protein